MIVKIYITMFVIFITWRLLCFLSWSIVALSKTFSNSWELFILVKFGSKVSASLYVKYCGCLWNIFEHSELPLSCMAPLNNPKRTIFNIFKALLLYPSIANKKNSWRNSHITSINKNIKLWSIVIDFTKYLASLDGKYSRKIGK